MYRQLLFVISSINIIYIKFLIIILYIVYIILLTILIGIGIKVDN